MKCMQPFPNTSSESTLSQHVDSKHSKFAFKDCFPTYGQDQAGNKDDNKNKKGNYNNNNKSGKKNKKKGKK